jgi:hypothetical protein
MFDKLSVDGDIKFGNLIWLQLIFGPKPCFLEPRQLARQKISLH